ncbi:hypothetical protein POSPLADRAFT_1052611 [Postia placenta MAD-698-R-SB12]|uniref:Uncharacterized protein n=1 Tax=Postia placenta MAD-698-R-SB12 TaxID=670580 RepID=A0A1X6NBC4_9APHY|nr:hypothetical protein POSPLADRAFT_1052611 [Postia placenta MAD-698-R-SB12]OSX65949.1 hypothetical protein POSPLADRAFT_1052611 [Postia placenta MAD-698-R-SB12]
MSDKAGKSITNTSTNTDTNTSTSTSNVFTSTNTITNNNYASLPNTTMDPPNRPRNPSTTIKEVLGRSAETPRNNQDADQA